MKSAQSLAENKRNRIALFAVSLGTAQTGLTLSSIQVSIPDIAEELSASAIEISWIPMAFLLVNAVFVLPAGRYADAVGRKRIYLAGMTLFGVSNLLAGLAQSMDWVLFCRGLQGLSTAMLHATGMAIIAGIFPTEQRTAALGIVASAIYLGLSFGPALGGFLTEYFGWRSVFAIQLPISVLNLLLVSRSLKGEWKSDDVLAVDWRGTVLLGLSLTALVLAIAPPQTSFSAASMQGMLVLFAIISARWFYRHLETASSPLIRLHAVRGNPAFSSALTSAFFVYAGNYTLVFLISLFLQYLLGLSPSMTGLFILLQPVTIAVVSLLAGRFGFIGFEQVLVAIGCAMVSASFLVLMFVDAQTPILIIGFALILNGIGMGVFTTPNNSSAYAAVDSQRLGAASAILNLARYLGNMLGTGVVLLMMAWLIGDAKLSPANYPELQTVVQYAFCFAFFVTAIASVLGFRFCWKSRKQPG